MKLGLLFSISLLLTHDYFISVCDIEYNQDEQVLEIAIKMTTHDLEHATDMAHLGTKLEPEDADKMIFTYLKKHFSISCDGQLKDLNWVGTEVEYEDMWVFLQIPDVPKFGHLTVTNSILCAHFEEQQNRVNVKVPEREDQSTVLSRTKTSHEFHFH